MVVKAGPKKPTEGPRGKGGAHGTRHYTLRDKDGNISDTKEQAELKEEQTEKAAKDSRTKGKRDPNKPRFGMSEVIPIPGVYGFRTNPQRKERTKTVILPRILLDQVKGPSKG